MRITRQDVKKVPPGRHNADPGLYLIVSKDGRSRHWSFRYTKPATGKVTEHGLGSVDVLAFEEARDKAHECRKAVAQGKDPVEVKRAERRAKTTFADMVTAFIALKRPGWRTEKHGVSMRKLLINHASALATKGISTITSDDIAAALLPLWSRAPDQGKRTLSAIRQVFDVAIGHGHCVTNPAHWRFMKHRLPNHRAAVKHHVAMNYTNVPGFVRRLHIEQQRHAVLSPYVIEFLMLTACRANEVIKMQWVEVDFNNKLWTVPALRTKTAREHKCHCRVVHWNS